MIGTILEFLRQEEAAMRERGLHEYAGVLAFAQARIVAIIVDFLSLRLDKEEAVEAVGYSIREAYRWQKDGMPADESGRLKLIDLPVKPGYLASVIGAPPLSELVVQQPVENAGQEEPGRPRWRSPRRRFDPNR